MRHLPTNGGGPAVTAVLGGNVNFFMSPTSIALPHIRPARCSALAVSSAKRAKSLPDVPTFKELGYDLEYYFWVGMFAPKGTPAPIITTLRDGLNKAAHSKQFLDTLDNLGQELAYMDQPEFAKFWAADAKRKEDAINASAACRDDTQLSPGPRVSGAPDFSANRARTIHDFARRPRRGRFLHRLRRCW